MKRKLITIAACAAATLAMAQAPAFPGAEGHGRYVTGGRNTDGTTKVYHVTNLKDDNSKGSLRWALSQSGPRTIVFDVSGYIDLRSELVIKANTTIAGQTAPGQGITLRYYSVKINGDNIIMRFIRSRRSQIKDVNDGADAIWGRNHKNIIFDHCSFSWSIDEVASFYDNANFTMQWCNVTEGLANPGHSKGAHSYGGIWGGKEASFHHNFIAHVQNRSPRFCGARYAWTGYDKTKYNSPIEAENVDFRNCLMYNWGNGNGCYGGTGGGNINIVNNYYKAGPGTSNKTRVTQVSVATSSNAEGSPYMGYACRYYINGNYVTAASKPENYDWSGVKYDSGLETYNNERYIKDANHLYGANETYVNINGTDCIRLKLDSPTDAGEVTTHTAQNTYEKILAYCGASLVRDAVDVRNMEEARTGTTTYNGDIAMVKDGKTYATSNTKGILDWINDPASETQEAKTASYPELESVSRPDGFDTDGDGMPDEWETANGLNPNDASDANLKTIDTAKGWYSNLEVYLNSIVENIMKAGNANAESAVNEYYPACQATGINNAVTTSEITKIEYYTLDGCKIGQPAHGISIRKATYANGKTVTDKVISK